MADAEFLKDPETNLSIGLPEQMPEILLTPNIGVIGVGGAGGNAVNNMIESHLVGASFIVANTDAQVMSKSLTHERIQLGSVLTQGLGAGSNPEIGKQAAEESHDKIKEALKDLHMLFIAAGMGGGTGTGASPVIARIAKEMGILTVGVVTKPFRLEGSKRMRTAEAGIEELAKYVDTLIIIPNQNLFRIAKENTSFVDAFKMADDILYQGVRSITDLMMTPMLINLDFADLKTVISEMGKAMMGSGEAEGENRALIAAEKAISNPLLDVSMKGAKGILINISGGQDLSLMEVDEAAERIRQEVDEDANIIFGASCDETLAGKIRVSVVATGLSSENEQKQEHTSAIFNSVPTSPVVITPPQPAVDNTESETDVPTKVTPEDVSNITVSEISLNAHLNETPTLEIQDISETFIPEPAVAVSKPIDEEELDSEEDFISEPSPLNNDKEEQPKKRKSFLADGFLPGIFGDRSSFEATEKIRLKKEGLKILTSDDELPQINEEDLEIPSFLRRKSE